MDMKPSAEHVKEYIHRQLQAHNTPHMANSKDYSFHLEQDDSIIAGIVAESVEDTVEVAYLYVEPAFRGTGLGRQLMEQVENQAADDGMKRVFLNTYSFQAPGFYEKLGYRPVLELSPAFGIHSQTFFLKEL